MDFSQRSSSLKKTALEKLDESLVRSRSILEALERKHIDEPNILLNSSLYPLRDAIADAENLLDYLDYCRIARESVPREEEKKKGGGLLSQFRSSFKLAAKHDPALEGLADALKRLEEAATGAAPLLRLLDACYGKQRCWRGDVQNDRVTSSLVSTGGGLVYGREKEKEELVVLLLNPDHKSDKNTNVSVVPIVGIGGVGKTTLAQYVYSDRRLKEYFEIRMWVHVFDDFNGCVLTKKILEAAIGKKPQIDNFSLVQRKLIDELRSKRFLLVLDDVWNDKDRGSWETIFTPLRFGLSGSKVLVTTTLGTVPEIMSGVMAPIYLKGLEDDDFWALFKACAFGDEDPEDHLRLQSVGLQIVKKLKGLPLAAKYVGGLLREHLDFDYWLIILKDIDSYLGRGDNALMQVLRLSYYRLPANLQKCFAYCSIFPRDHRFHKEDLVFMWMAAGLVQPSHNVNERLEDIGGRYFDELCKRLFFEEQKMHAVQDLFDKAGELSRFGKRVETYYIMNQLLYVLARLVSAGECFRVVGHERVNIPKTVRHLSFETDDLGLIKMLSELELKHLCSLHLSFSGKIVPKTIFEELFRRLKTIRVLCVSGLYFDVLPSSVLDLVHLRYLNISQSAIRELPESTGRLYHLQVLILGYPFEVREGMNNLIYLRHLISSSTIPGVGKLTSLQELKVFSLGGRNGCKIGELQYLKELQELHIQHLENIESGKEAAGANLHEKEHMKKLSLEWCHTHGRNELLDEEILDCLQPHHYLKELTILRYTGFRSPIWMENQSLSNLEYVCLAGCPKWKHLPPLGQLPYLRVVLIGRMDAVREVGPHSVRDGKVDVFPQLQELQFFGMEAWEEWSEGVTARRWFPCLRKLVIVDCPKLRGLPHHVYSLTTLEELIIRNCTMLKDVPVEKFKRLHSLDSLN